MAHIKLSLISQPGRTKAGGRWMIRLAVALLLPIAAKADLSQTIALQTGSTLNFDTGAISTSGGDLLFNSVGLVPQGSAKAKALGSPGYNYWAQTAGSLQSQVAASSATITTATLTQGKVFIVVTNSGKLAKGLVVQNSKGVLWMEMTTFGATPPAGQPFVSG